MGTPPGQRPPMPRTEVETGMPFRVSRWRPAIPLQPVLVLSRLLTLALRLAVLIMTGAWSHDLT